ncbi:DUF4976 domain-containing protein [Alteromonadaceae bacterium BrNp21-10]|nr:DUF4976 domain-containing protein [Alteromonadaceae bacterium BrNp21-10]
MFKFDYNTFYFKFITHHGVWDTEELYDINNDPRELQNLINDQSYLNIIANLRTRLFTRLENYNGEDNVPYTERFYSGAVLRGATQKPIKQ